MHAIRCKVFKFLWPGRKDKSKFHLVRWDLVARPKDMGGRSIKNSFWFVNALAAKSLR